MPKGHSCPVCMRYTLHPTSVHWFQCSSCKSRIPEVIISSRVSSKREVSSNRKVYPHAATKLLLVDLAHLSKLIARRRGATKADLDALNSLIGTLEEVWYTWAASQK